MEYVCIFSYSLLAIIFIMALCKAAKIGDKAHFEAIIKQIENERKR
jgi:hypothetical protein